MKSKNKFNIIDVIIILCVILIIGVTVFRAVSLNKAKALVEEKSLTFTVTVNDADRIYADSVKAGDTVYLTDTKLVCGTVESVRTEYMIKSETISDENGEPVTVTGVNPSKIKLYVNINTSGHFADSMIYLGNNTYISEGQRMSFYNETFTFEGILSDFNE